MKTLIFILLLCSPVVAQTPDFNFCDEPALSGSWRAASPQSAVPQQLKATDIHYVRHNAEREENAIVLVCVGRSSATEAAVQQQALASGWHFCTAAAGSGATAAWPAGWEAGVHQCKVIGGQLLIIGGDSYDRVFSPQTAGIGTFAGQVLSPQQVYSQPQYQNSYRNDRDIDDGPVDLGPGPPPGPYNYPAAGAYSSAYSSNSATPYGVSPIGTRHADCSVTVGYGQPYYVGNAGYNSGGYSNYGLQNYAPRNYVPRNYGSGFSLSRPFGGMFSSFGGSSGGQLCIGGS